MTSETAPRIIIVGDSGVGKTSLVHRIQTGAFFDNASPTIGAGVAPIEVQLGQKTYSFQLWDTAGQEMYRNIIPIYFRNAVYAIVTFSFTDLKSFTNLASWLDEVRTHADSNCGIVIAGNKHDGEDTAVTDEAAKEWAKEQGLNIFFTSALTGENVLSLIEYVAIQYSEATNLPNQPNSLNINDQANKKKSCC